jgi:hypothetical protein
MGFYGMMNKGYPVFSNVWKITGLNIHGFSGKTIAASVFCGKTESVFLNLIYAKKHGRVSKVIQHDLSSTHED